MDASFNKDGKRYTLAFERRLQHSPKKVWRVLTERDLLKQWFPADVTGDWQVGAALQFTFLHGEGEGLSEEQLRGEVLAVDAPKLLEFRWGDHYFRCELIKKGSGTTLLFSESFDDPSWGARNAAGWEFCLQNMDLLLDGAALAKFALDQWQKSFERYARQFEPLAGKQQGLPENYPQDGND